jgi:hypothetical protein
MMIMYEQSWDFEFYLKEKVIGYVCFEVVYVYILKKEWDVSTCTVADGIGVWFGSFGVIEKD